MTHYGCMLGQLGMGQGLLCMMLLVVSNLMFVSM